MRITKVIKIVKKSNVLTKQEKRGLIIKGLIETIVNVYKTIVKAPFAIIGMILVTLETLLHTIAEGIELIEQVFSCIVILLDEKLPECSLTKGQARDKLIKEIKTNTFKVK